MQEDFYHLETFAMDHWLEILLADLALTFLLLQVTRQK
jgi:hypothetical protein